MLCFFFLVFFFFDFFFDFSFFDFFYYIFFGSSNLRGKRIGTTKKLNRLFDLPYIPLSH